MCVVKDVIRPFREGLLSTNKLIGGGMLTPRLDKNVWFCFYLQTFYFRNLNLYFKFRRYNEGCYLDFQIRCTTNYHLYTMLEFLVLFSNNVLFCVGNNFHRIMQTFVLLVLGIKPSCLSVMGLSYYYYIPF